jgi:hypothetical protein
VNPALAPRSTTCRVCKDVADLADVALRLWDEDGGRLALGTQRVAKYLASIGVAGSKRALEARAETHRDHAERYMAGERTNVRAGDVIVPPSPHGPARWLDVQQDAMDVGRDALAKALQRLNEGGMEDKDVIALAKLGVGAAGKRADLEAKGRKLSQMDELLELAAGLTGQKRLTDGG